MTLVDRLAGSGDVPRGWRLVKARDHRLIATLGGATVIDAHPRKHRGGADVVERLEALERGEQPTPAAAHGDRASGRGSGVASSSGPAASKPGSKSERRSAPTAPQPHLDDAALALADVLEEDGERPRADPELAEAVGLDRRAAGDGLDQLVRAGRAVRVAKTLHYAPGALATLEQRIVSACERDGQVTIASVRDELETSRRYAQALLEHLDAKKVTRRLGDTHILRRRR